MLCYYFSKKYSQPVDQAANNNGTLTVSPIIVAVDTNGNDVIGTGMATIHNNLKGCPIVCSDPNPLVDNSQIIIG